MLKHTYILKAIAHTKHTLEELFHLPVALKTLFVYAVADAVAVLELAGVAMQAERDLNFSQKNLVKLQLQLQLRKQIRSIVSHLFQRQLRYKQAKKPQPPVNRRQLSFQETHNGFPSVSGRIVFVVSIPSVVFPKECCQQIRHWLCRLPAYEKSMAHHGSRRETVVCQRNGGAERYFPERWY